MAEFSQELGIHVITLYKWRKAWRLQGEVVPASQKHPEGWNPADKFTVVLDTAGLHATDWVANAASGACNPSRWTAGVSPPGRPMPSPC